MAAGSIAGAATRNTGGVRNVSSGSTSSGSSRGVEARNARSSSQHGGSGGKVSGAVRAGPGRASNHPLCRAQQVIPLESWAEIQETDLLTFARKEVSSFGHGCMHGWRRIWLCLTINCVSAYDEPSKAKCLAVFALRKFKGIEQTFGGGGDTWMLRVDLHATAPAAVPPPATDLKESGSAISRITLMLSSNELRQRWHEALSTALFPSQRLTLVPSELSETPCEAPLPTSEEGAASISDGAQQTLAPEQATDFLNPAAHSPALNLATAAAHSLGGAAPCAGGVPIFSHSSTCVSTLGVPALELGADPLEYMVSTPQAVTVPLATQPLAPCANAALAGPTQLATGVSRIQANPIPTTIPTTIPATTMLGVGMLNPSVGATLRLASASVVPATTPSHVALLGGPKDTTNAINDAMTAAGKVTHQPAALPAEHMLPEAADLIGAVQVQPVVPLLVPTVVPSLATSAIRKLPLAAATVNGTSAVSGTAAVGVAATVGNGTAASGAAAIGNVGSLYVSDSYAGLLGDIIEPVYDADEEHPVVAATAAVAADVVAAVVMDDDES
eukprot:CAMPEP_0119300310 /NCGR_PEP_ID=MMETSP1333-20130426/2261_1 /TAXON_ID=418940 /ORGANISM="Scyphosphaera apsteinii, Strain RCC1455" /LENGTH=557 /DNA_ID=CAMNT_0007302027 /DNA_START=312 /DNA_END=1985 /DNA_ORIENTATION=+